MADSNFLDNPIVLDPRNEEILTQEAKLYAFQRSNGVLNSLSTGDPLDVLVRTQAYTGAELLYYTNQLPLAFAIKFLQATGVTRSLGTKARADVTFRLVSARPTNFFIPKGFEITGQENGTYSFYTVDDLVIPAGQVEGVIAVEAKEVGSAYNLSAGKIRNSSQPLAFLQTAINLEAAQGGTDLESEASAVQRGVSALRRRNPISALDYQEEAEAILGTGSRCIAIGLLGADGSTTEKGAVHLFLLSSTGVPANQAEVSSVIASLSAKTMVGTRLYASAIGLLDITVRVVAKINADAVPSTVADALWITYKNALDLRTVDPGAAVDPNELSHQFRFTEGVRYVEFVLLNDDGLPIAMPNLHTLPRAKAIVCELVDENGSAFTEMRGDIELDID